ncbi:Putative ricin B-like lectin [Septoria linicola]|uniref:Ricin B-like lectin n=1 Tax=Septoria linicola TaxID=215465 RepID=A0A9Q9AQK2_9PEZI|nr:Putative ricin B-like lectin [Septoria linicola]
MPNPSYFLVPASSGLCIISKNGSVFTADLDGSQPQQWYIEREGDQKLALRNAESGDYLRASAGHRGAKVITSAQKQTWTLESGNTPNSFWIKNDEFENAYLCNSYGKYTANNLIYIWAREQRWTQTMLWYIHDFDSWNTSKNWPDTRATSSSELETRQQQIEAKEKELEQRQKDLERKQQDAEEREREALEFEQEAKIKQDDLAEKELELEAEKKAMKEARTTYASGPATNGDDSQWLQRFSKVQERLEAAQKEIERLRAQPQISDKETITDLKQQLKRAEQESSEHKTAYTALRNHIRAESQSHGIDGNSIKGRRLHTPSQEFEAASVGERWAPPGFRAGRDSAVTRGEGGPIAMPREFSHLRRL